jgi:acetolactate synthase-1/2/3 large subunit
MSAPTDQTTVAEVMAQAFVAEGVSQAFALLGDGNMHFAAALEAQGCAFTYARHEHCAVSMAMAYARVSGHIGVATVTCGPGLTQIMTALVAAVRTRIPMVILAGESPLGLAWYNQELEQAPFINACGASYFSVHDQRQLMPTLNRAFAQARVQSCPVVIGVPFDVQESAWQLKSRYSPAAQWPTTVQRVAPEPASVAAALAVIGQAQRIVVLGGRGVVQSGAQDVCVQLAARLDALLASTLPARGLFAQDPFNLNVAGGFSSDVAKRCFAQTDLVIAVGSRLAAHASDAGRLYPQAQVLHIDLEPAVMSQGRLAAQHHLRGDARLSVQALLEKLPAARPAQWRSEAMCQDIAHSPLDPQCPPPSDGRLDPREVVATLDEALPKHWMMVNSSGHCSYYPVHMRGRDVAQFLTIREFGAIGNGLSYVIGAAVARPDVPVVLFDGDGSFYMHVQELETMRRHGLHILVCVINDGGYGSEVHKLRADGVSQSGAFFGHDDLASVARGFGLQAHQVTDLSQVAQHVAEFAQAPGSTMVLDFHVSDQVLSPVMRRVTQH